MCLVWRFFLSFDMTYFGLAHQSVDMLSLGRWWNTWGIWADHNGIGLGFTVYCNGVLTCTWDLILRGVHYSASVGRWAIRSWLKSAYFSHCDLPDFSIAVMESRSLLWSQTRWTVRCLEHLRIPPCHLHLPSALPLSCMGVSHLLEKSLETEGNIYALEPERGRS